MTRHAITTLLALATACSAPPQAQNASVAANAKAKDSATATAMATVPLVIQSSRGARRFDVEVARTPAQQEQGLMFRKSLPDDGGMLFPMDPPRTASFWMKDTLIPLDLLFIHTDGTIAFLKAQAQPYDRTPVSAGIPVAAVLELRGGRAAQLGIAEGDRVAWGDCAVTPPKPGSNLNFCPQSTR